MTTRRARTGSELPASQRQRATRWAFGAGLAAALAVSPVAVAPVASADPGAGQPCPAQWSGVFTAAGTGFIGCVGGSWRPVAKPFNPADRWLSRDGVDLELTGQGRRNPQIRSGQWRVTPLDAEAVCSAEQAAVTNAGVAPPTTTSGVAGQPLMFEVVPVVFLIKLRGDCLWERLF